MLVSVLFSSVLSHADVARLVLLITLKLVTELCSEQQRNFIEIGNKTVFRAAEKLLTLV